MLCYSQTWTQTTTYLQLVGILLGQVFFGVMGDAVGRKAAMLTDMVRFQRNAALPNTSLRATSGAMTLEQA